MSTLLHQLYHTKTQIRFLKFGQPITFFQVFIALINKVGRVHPWAMPTSLCLEFSLNDIA